MMAAGAPSHSARAREAALALLRYCHEQGWSGYDPYDGLNSRLMDIGLIAESKVCRLALIQTIKRSPINIRPFLGVPRSQNPKALGLFLASLVKLERLGLVEPGVETARMVGRLEELRSPHPRYWCWGYDFPWQTRRELVPRYAPNLVSTIFVANALLDAYEQHRWPLCLEMAESAAAYLTADLFRQRSDGTAWFAYPAPSSEIPVHNANLLGAALLARIAARSNRPWCRDAAMAAARFSVSRQGPDGEWHYGEGKHQQWIDHFHTGYNLCALKAISGYADTDEFEASLRRGYAYYRTRFFRSDGAPKYFHDKTYPIDIHAVSQAVVTLLTFSDLDPGAAAQADTVLSWAMGHLRDRKGFFYYRALPGRRTKTSFMRWSQAWMLTALAAYLESGTPRHVGTAAWSLAPARVPARSGQALSYVLVTPARNEAATIENTIRSVISQTRLPRKWVIVSDGSHDNTDAIVERYLKGRPWMELVRLPDRKERHFAGKVEAFRQGYARIKDLSFDIIGSLDADITFGPDYFSFLLDRFAGDPRLGVAGTPFREGTVQYDYRFTSIEHVSGACQLFRRECFEEIGGYRPLRNGGVDLVAVTTARMKGWLTRTFMERVCYHHRRIGTAGGRYLAARFKVGRQDYLLGGHPLWEVFRALYQMKNRPFVIGGALLYLGYLWPWLRGVERPVSRELISFRRHEQLARLRRLFRIPAHAEKL